MNYKIVFTPNSKNDLYDIFRYIAFDLQSFENTAGQLDRLERAVKSLEQLPLRFRAYEKSLGKVVIFVLCLLIIILFFT